MFMIAYLFCGVILFIISLLFLLIDVFIGMVSFRFVSFLVADP